MRIGLPMRRPMAFRNWPPLRPPAPALYAESAELHRCWLPTPIRTPPAQSAQERELTQRSPTRNDPSTRLRTRKGRLAQAPKSEHFMGLLPRGSRRRSSPARPDTRRPNLVRSRAMPQSHRQPNTRATERPNPRVGKGPALGGRPTVTGGLGRLTEFGAGSTRARPRRARGGRPEPPKRTRGAMAGAAGPPAPW